MKIQANFKKLKMTTQEKINKIEKDKYNNYEHPNWKTIKEMNNIIRENRGDEYYLSYLEVSTKNIPDRNSFHLKA